MQESPGATGGIGNIDAVAALEISWYTPLTSAKQKYQELSLVDTYAVAPARTPRLTYMNAGQRAQPPFASTSLTNQRTWYTVHLVPSMPQTIHRGNRT